MKHQIMTVMLDAFLIINALPPKFLQKCFPLLFAWCICSIVYMEKTPLVLTALWTLDRFLFCFVFSSSAARV